MPDTVSSCARFSFFIALLFILTGCNTSSKQSTPVEIDLYQQWQLQPGDTIAGRTVTGGLGDVSIDLAGESIYAPFNGRIQPTKADCYVFSSAEVPGYMFRLCGISPRKQGDLSQGEEIGSGEHLEFAALRKQADGKWAIVEPSRDILERTLQKP